MHQGYFLRDLSDHFISGRISSCCMFFCRATQENSDYNYFRTYDPKLGRYIESDPIGLYGGLNTYTYVENNPLLLIDPLGLAGCRVSYPGYPITIPGTSTRVPLTHAGILSYDSKGRTRYYEYGRYDSDFGNVRRQPVPDLTIGPDGQPTADSWEKLQDALNKIGHGTGTKTSLRGQSGCGQNQHLC